MNKKQAQQEILRRLDITSKATGFSLKERDSFIKLLKYHSGEISKQELIKMITLDEDGDLLSEPEYIVTKYGVSPQSYYMYQKDKEAYQHAFNQAKEIVNCYDGE